MVDVLQRVMFGQQTSRMLFITASTEHITDLEVNNGVRRFPSSINVDAFITSIILLINARRVDAVYCCLSKRKYEYERLPIS